MEIWWNIDSGVTLDKLLNISVSFSLPLSCYAQLEKRAYKFVP